MNGYSEYYSDSWSRPERGTSFPKSPTAFPGPLGPRDGEEQLYSPSGKPLYPDIQQDEYQQSVPVGFKSSPSSQHFANRTVLRPIGDEYAGNQSPRRRPNYYEQNMQYDSEYQDDDYFRDPHREYDFVDRNVEPESDCFDTTRNRRIDDRGHVNRPGGNIEHHRYHTHVEDHRHHDRLADRRGDGVYGQPRFGDENRRYRSYDEREHQLPRRMGRPAYYQPEETRTYYEPSRGDSFGQSAETRGDASFARSLHDDDNPGYRGDQWGREQQEREERSEPIRPRERQYTSDRSRSYGEADIPYSPRNTDAGGRFYPAEHDGKGHTVTPRTVHGLTSRSERRMDHNSPRRLHSNEKSVYLPPRRQRYEQSSESRVEDFRSIRDSDNGYYVARDEGDYADYNQRQHHGRERESSVLGFQSERGRSRSPRRDTVRWNKSSAGRRSFPPTDRVEHSRIDKEEWSRKEDAVENVGYTKSVRVHNDANNMISSVPEHHRDNDVENSRIAEWNRKSHFRVSIPTPMTSDPQSENTERTNARLPLVIEVTPREQHVSFTPSTEVPSTLGSADMNDNTGSAYAKRVSEAKLLKEESEARHQILHEVRQAMEMRDTATTASDRAFWDRQVEILNVDLQKICSLQEQIHASPKPREINLEASPKSKRHNEYAAAAVGNAAPAATTLKVRAPEDLPGGHKFTVRINGNIIDAKVPEGGVRKGDIFLIRLPFDPTQVEPGRSSSRPETVKVRAPASLPEGYRFTAKMGEDRTIVATVPRGGVKKGEIFKVPIVDYKESERTVVAT